MSDWATAIVNKAHFVDVDNPPRGEEWDRILTAKVRRNKSKSFETQQQFSQPPINVQVHLPNYSPRRSPGQHASLPSRYSSTSFSPSTHTPRPSRRRVEPMLSSPVLLEHESWAVFEGDGLRAFIAHCESKFKLHATGFQEAYLKLQEHEIQPDVMRGKSVAWYEAKGIKSGIAERIVMTFNKWYARLLLEQET